VYGVDLANPHPGIDFINDLLHGLRPDPKQHFQQSAVVVEKRAKGIVGGHRYVERGNFQDVFGDVVNQIINGDLSAGGVKAGFAGEGNAMLSIAARADLAGVAPFGVAAKHLTLDDSVDIYTLIEGDFFFNPLIAPEAQWSRKIWRNRLWSVRHPMRWYEGR
jgi:hypothetical protein